MRQTEAIRVTGVSVCVSACVSVCVSAAGACSAAAPQPVMLATTSVIASKELRILFFMLTSLLRCRHTDGVFVIHIVYILLINE